MQVSLRPGLRWPGVTGIRVEVNGQVLSQGGDVAADQLEDTTAETINRCVRASIAALHCSECCAFANVSRKDLIICWLVNQQPIVDLLWCTQPGTTLVYGAETLPE